MKRFAVLFGAILSGLLLFFAFAYALAWVVWVALVPLLLALESQRRPSAGDKATGNDSTRFWLGFAAAATFSLCAFAWMIPGAKAFTGDSGVYGVLIFLVCVTSFSFVCSMLLYWVPGVILPVVWGLAETLLQWLTSQMPWFSFHIGNALASDLHAIQAVSVIGVTGIGVVILYVNYFLARALLLRSRKMAVAAIAIFSLYMAWGWILLPSSHPQTPGFKIALVKEHIPPEIPWDPTNGNLRVKTLLQAEDSCVATRPQMILWAESAIPWTYTPKDDLVQEIMKRGDGGATEAGTATAATTLAQARPAGADTATTAAEAASPKSRPADTALSAGITQILGINTAVTDGLVRNSAYCLLPDGEVLARYDKNKPLLFIEQRWAGLLFPFMSSDGYAVEPGESEEPLTTPYGKAGVLICNESVLPDAAAERARHGAQFLLNMSNDGWYRDSWLAGQHFYNVRLRAVETRKDIAVNSNNGWSGLIDASGRVDSISLAYMIHPNDIHTIAVDYPLLPFLVCLLLLLTIIIINKKTRLL